MQHQVDYWSNPEEDRLQGLQGVQVQVAPKQREALNTISVAER